MLLAIDTATRVLSLALHDGQAMVAESTWHTGDHHTVELAPNLALMLRRAGVEPARLAGIAVALGPGSYTGLRIGLGLAKGLALANKLSLLGVPTFEILMAAQPPRPEPVLAVLQAGRGRVAVQMYQWGGPAQRWQPNGEARVIGWAALAAEIAEAPGGEAVFVCGEIDAAGHEALHRLKSRARLAPAAQSLRRAGWLAEIGWERLRDNRVDPPELLAPLYGSPPQGRTG